MRRELLGVFVLAVSSCAGTTAAPDFDRDIKPILSANCMPCHAETGKTSGFSIANLGSVLSGGNRYGRAVEPGRPEQSALIKLLKGSLSPRMPLGKVLNESDISRIEEWVRTLPTGAAGSAQDTWWAFRKIGKPAPPAVKNTGWVRNPIDAFVLAKLEEKRLPPAPPANKRTLARRVYFDLVGMPPSPEELEAF